MLASFRKHGLFVAKLALGVGLLAALLLVDDNGRRVADLGSEIRVVILVPFFGITAVLMWISCLKWRLFLHERKMEVSTGRLMVLYTVGTFFNNFLPSSVGGDAVRSHMLGRRLNSQGGALASVFLERFTGFVAMVSLTVVSFTFSAELRGDALIRGTVLATAAAAAGVVVLICRPEVLTWIRSILPQVKVVQRVYEKALRFHEHLFRVGWSPGLILRTMLLSYTFYGFAAVKVYLAGLLLGIECSLPQLLVVTPLVMLIAAIPLTPNGLGIWEWGFSVYLTSAGATAEQGLAIALALRAQDVVVSLLGGVLFLLEPKRGASGGRLPGVVSGTLDEPAAERQVA